MQHYHSRLHVICVCCPDPESKKSSHKWSPSSGSSPEWEGRGCPAPWAAMGISCFQEHVLWRPKKNMFVGCTWHSLGISFASLSIVGECWISLFQSVAVKLLRNASHDSALPGIPVLQCQLSCLELFPKSLEPWDAPTTFFHHFSNGTYDLYWSMTCLQFELITSLGRTLSRCGTLKREDPLAGIPHLKCRKRLPVGQKYLKFQSFSVSMDICCIHKSIYNNLWQYNHPCGKKPVEETNGIWWPWYMYV